MGIQIIGSGGTVIGAGEETRKAMHVQAMPKGGTSYRISAFTGTIGAALAAASEVFQFRFLSGTKTFAIVYKVEFEGMGIVAVATAAGPVGFEVVPARAWSVAGSGGTRIANSGDNMQMETSIANSQVNDIGIATTAALTAGTKTLDANAVGGVLGGVGTGAVTIYGPSSIVAPNYLLNALTGGDMPLVLANQEGFVIRTSHVGPAALTYVARFSVAWSEVTAF
jgi:hypothetical protein